MNTKVIRFGRVEHELEHAGDRSELLNDPAFLDRAAGYVRDIVAARGVEVLSFDVFDTVLLRDDKSELTRFAEIAERICEEVEEARCELGDALIARLVAARACYRTGPKVEGCREGTLGEIHELLSIALTGSVAIAARSAAIELDYEEAHLAPSRLARRLAEDHIARGGRVVLLSDMYLSAAEISGLLDAVDPGFPRELVVSSADEKLSKKSGLLFGTVAARLGISPDRFLHVGDSLTGDYQRPIQAGWHAVHLPVPASQRGRIYEDFHATLDSLEAKGVPVATMVSPPSW